MTIDQVMASLRPKLSAIPGLRVSLQNPPPIRLGGRQANSNYQYTLQSADTTTLYSASQALLEKMRKMPGLSDVNTDLFMKNPTLIVDVDRDRAASLGLNLQQVEDALYSAYATRQISTIYAPTNAYQVIMELDPQYEANPQALSMLYVRSLIGTARSAQHRREVLAELRAARSQSLRPAAVGHDLVQHQAGLLARRSGQPTSARSRNRRSPRTSAPRSRAPRRRSSRRCRASACCCSLRSRSSTWSSASSTRASSIR